MRKKERTPCSDLPVMHVSRRAQARAAVGLREEHHKLAAGVVGVHDLALVEDPVILGGVAVVVSRISEDTVKVCKGVLRWRVQPATRERRGHLLTLALWQTGSGMQESRE